MATVLEPPETTAAKAERPPFLRRLAISVLRFVIIATIAAVVGGGWYLTKRGFGRQWRLLVVEELHKRGVEASVAHLTLSPFRGLVAQDVRIFDYKHRENTLALISEVALDINYAALFHHQPFLNALDVRNAQLTLPIAGGKGKAEKPQLKRFRAHIYFPPDQIYVSQAEGYFCGIRVSASGQLINKADSASPPLSEEEWQKRLGLLQRIVTELQKLSFPAEHPSLQVKFSGNLADMENGRIQVNLRGERIRRQNYEIHDLVVAAEFADQRLSINQFEWKDAAGSFLARGSWGRQNQAMNFQARSSIDLKSFVDAFGITKILADATFATPPTVEVSGTGNLGEGQPQFKLIGSLNVANFSYKGVPFAELGANFSWDGEHTLLRDIHLRHQSGAVNAELFDAPNDFRLDFDSTISPAAFRGVASPEMRDFLNEWVWPKSPKVHLEIRGPEHDPKTWQGNGTIALDRTRFRGIWMNSATTDVHFKDGAVTYENLKITRDEGVATGGFTYDFKNHEVRISNIKSSLRPSEIIFWIDPTLWKTVTPYRFKQAPAITANGVYQFHGGKNTRLDLTVDAPAGMDYVFVGKTLPLDRVNSKLVFTNDRLQIIDLKGTLFNGSIRGGADISLAKNDPHYKANITVDSLDFPRLTELYYNYKSAQGRLSGTYNFTGLGGDARTMRGTGKIDVTNGDVFAIPIFGPLSEILNSLLPGTGYSIARNASANVDVKDGKIHTDDFQVAGKLFSMLGYGDIYFLDDKLDFNVRMSMKGPGVLLAPVYKLFEYTGEGSLKHPNWHPKRF